MIPFLFFGALMTQLLPITTYQSLEEVNYKNSVGEGKELIGVGRVKDTEMGSEGRDRERRDMERRERDTAAEKMEAAAAISAGAGGGMSRSMSMSKERERERDAGPVEIRMGDRELEMMDLDRTDPYRGNRK
jgi:hypothetical protein